MKAIPRPRNPIGESGAEKGTALLPDAEEGDAKQWRWVPGHEGRYRISSTGQVVGPSGRLLKLTPSVRDGYPIIRMWVKGVGHSAMPLHRALLLAFKSRGYRPGLVGRHLNDDPMDNRLENLEWGSKSDNGLDAVANGRAMVGEASPVAKLTAEQVCEIRRLRTEGLTYAEIAGQTGATWSNVSKIIRGISWKHLA